MAYTKQNYQPGDVLTAEQVNKIQDVIIKNEGNVESHINDKTNPHGITAAQIGAAPAGYGVGKLVNYPLTDDSEVDSKLIEVIRGLGDHTFKRIVLSFTTINNFTGGGGHYYADIYKLSENYAIVTVKSYINGGKELRRIWYEGALKPWEWVNPHMVAGVEYRTTKRYLGKPVYTKVIDFGTMPNSTYATVNTGIENGEYVVSCTGHMSSGAAIPYTSKAPISQTVGNNPTYQVMFQDVNTKNVTISALTDFSSLSAYVTLEYTKTTD